MHRLLRVGVIGVGHFGRLHALKAAASPRMALVGVADRNAARAAAIGRELGGVPALEPHALLAVAEAVIIAAPADAHYPLARAALEAGRHVLVEKPIAATLAEADALARLAASRARVLQVGHLLRYGAEHAAIASRVPRPLYIEATRIAPFKPRGTDVSVILDLMIHDLDLVLSLVPSEIESVDALGAAVSSEHEDIANARVRFENGCVASITASRVSLKTERRMRLFSEDGYCSADFVSRRLTVIGRGPEGVPVPGADGFFLSELAWEEHDVLEAEQSAWAAACLDGAPVLVDATAGRRALAAALAVSESMAESRRRVRESGLAKQTS